MSTNFYDTNLSTVDYQIIFTKRDFEAVLEHGTITVAKAMTGNGFASWKIAEFIQKENSPDGIKVPAEWVDKTPKELKEVAVVVDGGGNRKITKFKRTSLEYLQVEYQVLSTLDRNPAKYDQDKVNALRDIADGIGELPKKEDKPSGGPGDPPKKPDKP